MRSHRRGSPECGGDAAAKKEATKAGFIGKRQGVGELL
jgi:hypothetical protein